MRRQAPIQVVPLSELADLQEQVRFGQVDGGALAQRTKVESRL
jgi:hypothetical protein